jgi:hypothetical protein
MLLYSRENHLLAFVIFVHLALCQRGSHFTDFCESACWGHCWKSIGKHSLVKIGPKIIAQFNWRPKRGSTFPATYRHIHFLSYREAESGCSHSRTGMNITSTRLVTYNVHCRLVLNWPGVEVVRFSYCIYQHRRSHDWSVFLSPDHVTLDGMRHRRNYTIWFCTHHRIDVANVPQLCNETVTVMIATARRC